MLPSEAVASITAATRIASPALVPSEMLSSYTGVDEARMRSLTPSISDRCDEPSASKRNSAATTTTPC